ncbi:MAG: lysophospholipid acyltransferase family protein [Anaerolineales bacterium]|nr:lysophospholipid acyltransferase family protein [Anaerolineales bacterium]MCB0007411.1 lysophospholipid acyltransferase family protein [Anaerolineales bacterium]MCB0013771.1 lysophospholipid acyltransferase family protein [Anaerolineales bacterium]MCB0030658.1 lysophospholipid acyltransferase family protein [Anaerolineales bacterium]MCB8962232.1 lysophospholipid acyltransferase family protein [Ardenticatenales bacterium]
MMREEPTLPSARRRLANTPIPTHHIPQRGNWFSVWLGSSLLSLFGWRFEGNLPQLSKFVAIGAPHTSSHDVFVAVWAFWALGLRVNWMAKHTLFKGISGIFFRWMDAVPINRTSAHGVVSQMTDAFASRDKFILALAPEGTRAKVDRWKTGFYHIACAAHVPILPVALDFGHKVIRFGNCLWPTGELEADLAQLQSFYQDVVGHIPARG